MKEVRLPQGVVTGYTVWLDTRPGVERRKCRTAGDLRNALWDLLLVLGENPADHDIQRTGELIRAVDDAKARADNAGTASIAVADGRGRHRGWLSIRCDRESLLAE